MYLFLQQSLKKEKLKFIYLALKRVFIFFMFFNFFVDSPKIIAQENEAMKKVVDFSAFKTGEWLQYRIHYGIFNASYATLSLKQEKIKGINVLHAKAYARTKGLLRFFFKLEDIYESYFKAKEIEPLRFIRDIYEGGYTKNKIIDFDSENNLAFVDDIKNNIQSSHRIKNNTQDLISTFYYLRNYFPRDNISQNESFNVNVFFDEENYDFNLKFMGIEILNTKFGKVECLKLIPVVQKGRVFKDDESITLWVSNDANRIPIRIKADIAIGSLDCDLENFKNIKHPFKIKIN